MGVPRGNAHFKESVYELHKRESHGFSPSVSHRLDHEVSLQVLEGALRERIRTIIRQLCKELGVQIVSGVLSREHVHMFVEIPPTSPPPAATSRTTLYFSIFRSTNLPAPAGTRLTVEPSKVRCSNRSSATCTTYSIRIRSVG